jgi:hypothetical protein
MKEADIDGNGTLDFNEFAKIMVSVEKSSIWSNVSKSFYSKYFESHSIEALKLVDSLLESPRELIKSNSNFIEHKHPNENVVLEKPGAIARVVAYLTGSIVGFIFCLPFFWPGIYQSISLYLSLINYLSIYLFI